MRLRRRGAAGLAAIGALLGCGGGGSKGDGGPLGPLTACAIATRPSDPVDGGADPVDGGAGCNTLIFGGAALQTEWLDVVDGGAAIDAGIVEAPAGGTIRDGDYDLVRIRAVGVQHYFERSSLRIFDGASYIEWLFEDQGTGVATSRYDTTSAPAGIDLGLGAVTCGPGPRYNYRYTASGDELVLFGYGGPDLPLTVVSTYQRTCTR